MGAGRPEQLVDYFRDAGVDEDRINYLQDSDATTKSDVEAAFVEMLDETEERRKVVPIRRRRCIFQPRVGRACGLPWVAGLNRRRNPVRVETA